MSGVKLSFIFSNLRYQFFWTDSLFYARLGLAALNTPQIKIFTQYGTHSQDL